MSEFVRKFVKRLILQEPPVAPVSAPLIPAKHIANSDFRNYDHFSQKLDELSRALTPGKVVTLTGHAGIGKTYLAREYASRLPHEGIETYFASVGEGKDALISALLPEAKRFYVSSKDRISPKPSGKHGDDGYAQQLVEEFLCSIETHPKILIVLDNLDRYFEEDALYDQLSKLVPERIAGRLLFTTRDPGLAIARRSLQYIDVSAMNDSDGAEFLISMAGLPTSAGKAAEAVSKMVGGLPLALAQSAAYINHRMSQPGSTYTVEEYIRDWQRDKSEVRTSKGVVGAHDPLFRTYELAYNRLKVEDPHSAHVWAVCSALSPDHISQSLIHMISSRHRGVAPLSKVVSDPVRELTDRRLLDTVSGGQEFAMHRSGRAALRDILATEGVLNYRLHDALAALDSVISSTGGVLPSGLYPHVESVWEAFAQNTSGDEAAEMLASQYPHLAPHCEDVRLLQAVDEGNSWQLLLYGTESPNYKGMKMLEQADVREKIKRRMAVVGRARGAEEGRTIFACVYLLVHYWWDLYLPGDHIGDPLLVMWREAYPDEADRKLGAALDDFQKAYPPVREYKERTKSSFAMSGRWNQAGKAMLAVREMLKLTEPLEEDAPRSRRYARGMTNLYLAESLRHGRGLAGYSELGSEESLNLYSEAITIFEEDEDSFHHIWLHFELADFHVECSQRYRDNTNALTLPRGSNAGLMRNHIEAALHTASSGLSLALKAAEGDDVDTEVIAYFYTTLASAYWASGCSVEEALAYRLAACFCGYAFLFSEKDNYSASFYEEQVERTLDWLQEALGKDATPTAKSGVLSDARVAELCQTIRQFWGSEKLPAKQLDPLVEARDWETLVGLLFPSRPPIEGISCDATVPKEHIGAIGEIMLAMPGRIEANFPLPFPQTFFEAARAIAQNAAEMDDDDA
jgi:hypothetical protein